MAPEFSISLCVAAKGTCDPARFIRALRQQGLDADPHVEIHVAHDAPLLERAALEAIGCRLHLCPEGTSILRLWGIAIAASTTRFAATLDIHCPPDIDWWAGVRRELQLGNRVITGSVVPGWRPTEWMIAGYLVEYAQFHRPYNPAVTEVPGINFICSRALLDPADTLATRGFFKTFMLWRLARERNIVAVRSDDIQVVYWRPLDAKGFLCRRYLHGRCFGARRHEQPGQPPWLACVLFAPALPLLKGWRIWRAARRQPDLHYAYWRQLHWIVLSEIAWSVGELVGYLSGAGTACERLD